MIRSIALGLGMALALSAPALAAKHMILFQQAAVWGPDDRSETFNTGDGRLSIRLLFHAANGGDTQDTAVPSKIMEVEAHVCNRTPGPVSIKYLISRDPREAPTKPLTVKGGACVDTESFFVPSGVKSYFFIME